MIWEVSSSAKSASRKFVLAQHLAGLVASNAAVMTDFVGKDLATKEEFFSRSLAFRDNFVAMHSSRFVFVSYTHEDRERVDPLVALLDRKLQDQRLDLLGSNPAARIADH